MIILLQKRHSATRKSEAGSCSSEISFKHSLKTSKMEHRTQQGEVVWFLGWRVDEICVLCPRKVVLRVLSRITVRTDRYCIGLLDRPNRLYPVHTEGFADIQVRDGRYFRCHYSCNKRFFAISNGFLKLFFRIFSLKTM